MGPRRLLSGTLVASLVATLVAFSPTASRADCAGSWSKFQYDLSNTAAPCGSNITTANVATLAPRWFAPTQSPVSATPAVVGGVAYAGDWDGTFHALDANTGLPLWAFDVKHNLIHDDQHTVSYAEIASSASVADLPPLGRTVFFGGGGTLYALDAATGLPRWAVDTDPIYRNGLAVRGGLAIAVERGAIGGFVEPECLLGRPQRDPRDLLIEDGHGHDEIAASVLFLDVQLDWAAFGIWLVVAAMGRARSFDDYSTSERKFLLGSVFAAGAILAPTT